MRTIGNEAINFISPITRPPTSDPNPFFCRNPSVPQFDETIFFLVTFISDESWLETVG